MNRYVNGGYIDSCQVQLTFLDQAGNELGVLKSHEVPDDSVVMNYTSSVFQSDTETLAPNEFIIGVKVQQDSKGANTSIQFLIADQDPNKRNRGRCCN